MAPGALTRPRTSGRPATGAHASLTIATIMPMTTNTTIAVCIQIQVGDIARGAYWREQHGG
jgi:hypothetical protein